MRPASSLSRRRSSAPTRAARNTLRRLLLGLPVLLPVACQPGPAMPVDLAITGADVVDVITGEVHPDRTVLVAEGRILAVEPSADLSVPEGTDVVDATGSYVIPGLWDTHVHSAANVEWHFPLFLAHGVTSVRNMHSTVDSPLALTNAIKARLASGEILGPRFLANGGVVDGDPPIWPGSLVATTEAEGRAVVDSLVAGGADFVKVYERLSPTVFAAIADQARARGIPVDGHVPFAVPAEVAAAAGQRTMEHGTGLALGCSSVADSLRDAHAELVDALPTLSPMDAELRFFELIRAAAESRDPDACRRVVRALVENGVAVTPTLVLFQGPEPLMQDTVGLGMLPVAVRERWTDMAQGPPHPFAELMAPVAAQGPANVRMLHQAGVTILAGTDLGNPFLVPGRSLHDELETLVRDAGLSPLDALRSATVNPARTFGMADSLGAVSPGMRADLVLLRSNPLADIAAVRSVHGVVLDGRFLDRDALDGLVSP